MNAPLGFTTVRPARSHAYGAVVEDGAWVVIDTNGPARLVTRHATKREAEWAVKSRHAGPAGWAKCYVGLASDTERALKELDAQAKAPKTQL